jgi:hypothetical protein
VTIFDLDYLENLSENTQITGGLVVAYVGGVEFLTQSLNGSVLGSSGANYDASASGAKSAATGGSKNSYVAVGSDSTSSGASLSSVSASK